MDLYNQQTVYYEKKINELSCVFCNILEERPHLHSENEFVFCIHGKAIVEIANQSYELKEGQGIFIAQYQTHNYKNLGVNSEFAIVCFSNSVVTSLKNKVIILNNNSPVFDYTKITVIEGILKEIRNDYIKNKLAARTLVTAFVNALMYYTQFKLHMISNNTYTANVFNNIINYCLNNYKDKITVDTIARELSISTTQISQVFNDIMQMRIPTYVNFLRVSEACRLLKETDYSVTEIAHAVGFASLRNFNRAFEAILKMAPSEYKKTVTTERTETI